SSSFRSIGMPRPLSTTDTELSACTTTLMSSQKPASASSIELSRTSNTMWCRPVPSDVSPMYMPGRLRTASRPFSTLMLLESYSSPLPMGFALLLELFGMIMLCKEASGLLDRVRHGVQHAVLLLDAHRHHDVFVIFAIAHGDQSTR